VSALDNPSNITDSNADDGTTDFIEPPEDPSAASEPEAVAQPIPTLDSKPRTNADALPPKPNTFNNGVPLSYSAQVAEQFSSSYRQTPSQERGRLDAARLAQFNQSGSTGASSTDGLSRMVRPSEMKDEGCVFHRSFILYLLLYVKGGVYAPRVAPVVHIYRSTVRQLLSGSVHAYESPPPATCVYQMLWRTSSMASRLTCTVFLISLFRILVPRMSNLLVFSAMSLCYAYAYPPLCIPSASVDYLSSGTIRQILLTARCLLAAYPGIQQMVLFPPFISHSTHCPFCNVMSLLLTYVAECAVGGV